MQFKRLRLHGFKSFVDQTEMLIEEGLTGVVGPNGCGKSNVIESLRWVMGETSAKRMRGNEMDDVIFGGSGNRPPRNIAEVTVTLDNSLRTAPANFNDEDELEITRRIERGKGSGYRINGRDVRARDVQLLFADLASGANSTAIVSQGRIGALIGARPAERRILLEEAAGIKGLHSRRHEAELRLKAAETNLERLEDVLTTLDGQNQALQKQARQANRYRKLSEQIRQFEAMLFHIRWTDAETQRRQAQDVLQDIEHIVEDKTRLVASHNTAQIQAAENLPTLRHTAAETAATLQRYQLHEREIQNEESRLHQARVEIENRLQQLQMDLEREKALELDALEALTQIQEEKARFENHGLLVEDLAELQEIYEIAKDAVEDQEQDIQAKAEEIALLEGRRQSVEQRIKIVSEQLEQQQQQLERLYIEKADLEIDLDLLDIVAEAEENVATAELALELTQAQQLELEENYQIAQEKVRTSQSTLLNFEKQARQERDEYLTIRRQQFDVMTQQEQKKLREIEQIARDFQAEHAVLEKIIAADLEDVSDPLQGHLTISDGYEQAVGAALRHELELSLNPQEKQAWRSLRSEQEANVSRENIGLPENIPNLSSFVTGPQQIYQRLDYVGLVETVAMADQLQQLLKPGQYLVTRQGGVWSWDGVVIHPDIVSDASQKLSQKKRYQDLEKLIQNALLDVEESEAQAKIKTQKYQSMTNQHLQELDRTTENELVALAQAAENALLDQRELDEKLRQRRQEEQQAYQSVTTARQAYTELTARSVTAQSKLQNIDENITRLQQDIEKNKERLTEETQTLNMFSNVENERETLQELKSKRTFLQQSMQEKQLAFTNLKRDIENNQIRLERLAQDEYSWQQRMVQTQKRIADLQARQEEYVETKLELEIRPEELAEKREQTLDLIHIAEIKRNEAAELLAQAERQQYELEQILKTAEKELAEARETRVRLQAGVEQAQFSVDNIAERIREKLKCTPRHVLTVAEIDPDQTLPPKEELERKLDRYNKERHNMGAVNLRAEQEVEELSTRIQDLIQEQDDLIEAIGKLRQGITALNKEGRERLLAAYHDVNGHFKKLFVKLFGGGEAELKLTEAEDPLQAGLEIMASPPGKRMQVMSLLSGGEQALTALSLLFAVFLTNPAPICVLDEVDAPLDDANVDRFCKMLEEMSESKTTRFLVVTHHRMTMARLDRLFGVTMAERGVSQLVSVDLRKAEKIRETA